MKSPTTLQQAIQIFSDYENCREFMVSLRWPDGKVLCPRCESDKVGYLEKSRVYVCYAGHKKAKFSLKVGTVFEDSPIPLEKWLPAVWMLTSAKNGMSSWELHRALGVTQKSAWFMLHRVRAALKTGGFGRMTKLGGDSGPIEVDETFIGGKIGNMHESKRRELRETRNALDETSHMNKTIVQGFLDRELRQVRAKVIPDVKRETLQNGVLQQVKYGSVVYTDEAPGYNNLRDKFIHDFVNKMETYVDGNVHVNGMENFWSLLKRTLKGTYVAVEPFHMQRHLDEQIFRFNNRATHDNPLNDADRFTLALSQIVGKRLTYSELTGKDDDTTPF